MKFGQNFHLFQVPEWEVFYVNYNLLKQLIKKAVKSASQPNFTETYACLNSNIETLESFRKDKCDFWRRSETELCNSYGISISIPIIPALNELDEYELKQLLEAFGEIRKGLMRLQWYERVNQDAVQRIYAKIDKCCESVGRSHAGYESRRIESQLAWGITCLEEVERLDRWMANIDRARSQSGPPRRSLYLKNLCNERSPALIEPDDIFHPIRNDQPSTLATLLHQTASNCASSGPLSRVLLYGLLEFSMMCHASKCVAYLLSQVLSNNEDLVDRDCLTNLIIIAGRNSMPATFDGESLAKAVTNQVPSDAGVNLLLQILEQIGPGYHNVMGADDVFRRQPLHYGALYGLTSVCQAILNCLQGPEQDISASRQALLSVDCEGFTPLHFAVTCNYVPLVRIFLDALGSGYGTGDNAEDDDLRSVLGGLLLLALRFQYDDIVYLLSARHIDTNQRSTNGQTALHVVAQIGRDDYMKLLLKATSKYHNAVNVSETVYGWTPLFFACVAGHLTLVKVLLQAGASQTILDHQGWTAKEHAAFRGHLAIAGTLEMCNMRDPTGGPASKALKAFVGAQCHFRTGHSYIIANLGVTQIGRQVTAVNLNFCSSEYSQSLHSNTRYSIEICAPGRNGSSYLVQLPVLDEKIDEPFVSPIDNSSDARLIFNIYRATPMHGTKGILAGSGTALLKRNSHLFGANRESLIREQTIPILERGELNCIGTVTFTFVIVNPPTQLHTSRLTGHSNEGADEVQLVGHRGLGQNTANHTHLQLGENTTLSFLSAAKQGASFVEFDVQVTRDLVPIIYHDFSLSESGTDVPIHDLSLEQFMYASKVQSPRGAPISMLGRGIFPEMWAGINQGRPRARSVTRDQECRTKTLHDRMKHTVDFIKKGFKPNTRGDFIQDSFPTLEELLIKLPKSISFDVEIKYPRLHEAVDAGVAPVAIELNKFIDTALDKIYRFGGDRTIILSSFSPDVCILLAIKQQAYPVMFITNAGKLPMTDMELRAGSLQAAVHFAKRWNLAGVVLASETMLLCPRLIRYVKNLGLSCGTYGPANDIPENVQLQVEAGLDIIVADRVGLISKALESINGSFNA